MFKRKKKFNEFALSFSGGGARGIAHAGFLKAIDESGLKPCALAGTSMGAIVAAFYAAGNKPEDFLTALHSRSLFRIPSWISLHGGFASLDILHKELKKYIEHDSFEQLNIPLVISATNLNTSENELFSSGKLIEKVIASASIPVVFKPALINGQYYVDGGLTNNMPLKCLNENKRLVVGINCNFLSEDVVEYNSIKRVTERSLRIGIAKTLENELKHGHILFDIKELSDYSLFDYEHASKIFEIGYGKGKEAVLKIKQLLK